MVFHEKAFVPFPLQVLYCDKLTLADLRVYATIVNLCNINDVCTAGNGYFKKLFGINDRTVRRSLEKLEELQFIKIKLNGSKRQISLPFSPVFQAVDNFTKIEEQEELPQGVLDLVDKINDKQKEKYPYYDPVKYCTDMNNKAYGVNLRLVILTLAKAVYNTKFVGVTLNKRKIDEEDLQDLVEVFDISRCRSLVNYLCENFETIKNLDYYIMTALFERHEKLLQEYQEEKIFDKNKAYNSLSSIQEKVNENIVQLNTKPTKNSNLSNFRNNNMSDKDLLKAFDDISDVSI